MGNPSLNHRYRKGFYSLFKTLQQNHSQTIMHHILSNAIVEKERNVSKAIVCINVQHAGKNIPCLMAIIF
ncbi:hypothetical protein [Enterococcus faecium]|uniref:hypothetical protein n=1 Tax=Enterococcus faecium TaxID=1352 RepID=UPI003137DB9D